MNYPLKRALIQLEEDACFDVLNQTHKFCVSAVSIQVCNVGIVHLIHAHNAHRIPGRNGGIPNVFALRERQAVMEIPVDCVPSGDEAVCEFIRAGGHLTLNSSFGVDPLLGNQALQRERDRRLAEQCLTMDTMDTIEEECFGE